MAVKKMSVLAIFVAALSVMPGRVDAQRGMTRITGKVTDTGTGAALADVQIKAVFNGTSIFDTATDTTGEWAIGNLGKGEWSLVFEKAGYAPRNAKVTLPVDLARVPPIAITLRKN